MINTGVVERNINLSLETLGEYVNKRRKSLGLTQDQFAAKLDRDQAYVYRLESGKQVGSISTLISVARALEVRPGYLLDLLADIPGPETSFPFKLPDNLEIEEIKDLQTFINFLEFKKGKSDKHFGKPTEQDFIDTANSLPTDEEMAEGEALAREIETKAKQAKENKQNGDKI